MMTPKLQAKVLEATRRKPADGSTHWSCRKLAEHLHISKDAVHRIWRTAGIRPHLTDKAAEFGLEKPFLKAAGVGAA